MSISYKADGSIVLQSDEDPGRTQTIPPNTPKEQQDADIVAFFAIDQVTAPAVDTGAS